MIVQLQENDLMEVSRQMRENNKKWQERAEIFWDDAVRRSMDVVDSRKNQEDQTADIRSKLASLYAKYDRDAVIREVLHSEF